MTEWPNWHRLRTLFVAVVVALLIIAFALWAVPTGLAQEALDWTPTASLSQGLASPGVVINGDKLYVIGGQGGTKATSAVSTGNIEADGSIRAILSTSTVSLPIPLYLHAVASTNQYVFVIGGWDDAQRYASVWRANLPIIASTDSPTWTLEVNSYPRKIVLHSAIAVGDYLYVLGGVDENNIALNEVFFAHIEPNGNLDNWRITTAMPKALFRQAVTTYNGYIYVTGGYDGKSAVREIYYAQVKNSGGVSDWKIATRKLNKPVYYHEAIVRRGRLFILGGKDNDIEFNQVFSNSFEENGDIKQDWYKEPDLPVSLYRFAAVTPDTCQASFIYTIGGLHKDIFQSQIFRTRGLFCYYFPIISSAGNTNK
ncbi:MAG: hypothetical protein NT075_08330 [Chloroflexi bacterium]|nr:hypothetical protein [Chloroflexota bacterium]